MRPGALTDTDPGGSLTVRAASPDDVPALGALSAHYVRTSTTTFGSEPRPVEEWMRRVGTDAATTHLRVLVAERDGAVVGYAETDRFRPKAGYDRSIEVTAYVGTEAVGAGVGTALYDVLIPSLVADRRFHRAYALIVLPNPASIALHQRFGFAHRGTLTEVGYKFDRYLDVAYYQRDL